MTQLENNSIQRNINLNLKTCETCGEPLEAVVRGRVVRIPCSCRKRLKTPVNVSGLDRYNMLFSPMYKDVSFKTTETNIYEPFREKIRDALNNRCGLFIYGDVGVGKTRLMMCLAKEMEDPLVIKFDTLTEQLRATYRHNDMLDDFKLLDQVYHRPNLFIDDLGVDSFFKNNGDNFNQRILYKVVENRMLLGKQTTFTSNYSISELINDRGVEQRTCDRIVASCRSIEMRGRSRRW